MKVGALWQYASNETGEVFLSGRIDDPSLDKPLDVALFNQDDGSYNVAWRRPKAKRSLPAATNDENSLPSLPGFGEESEEDQRPGGDGLGESTYGADQQQAA